MPESETWSPPETVRAIKRIEAATVRIEETLSSTYVRRDVYLADQRGLADWKREIATDLVNMEAEQARIRKEHRNDIDALRGEHSTDIDAFRVAQRWAVGIALTAAAVVIAGAGVLINAMNAAGLG